MIVRYSGITGANIVYQTRYQKNNTNIQKCFFFSLKTSAIGKNKGLKTKLTLKASQNKRTNQSQVPIK